MKEAAEQLLTDVKRAHDVNSQTLLHLALLHLPFRIVISINSVISASNANAGLHVHNANLIPVMKPTSLGCEEIPGRYR